MDEKAEGVEALTAGAAGVAAPAAERAAVLLDDPLFTGILDAAIARQCVASRVDGGTQLRREVAALMGHGKWFAAAQAMGTSVNVAQDIWTLALMKADGEPGEGGPVADVAAAADQAVLDLQGGASAPAGTGPLLRGYRALGPDELALIDEGKVLANQVGEFWLKLDDLSHLAEAGGGPDARWLGIARTHLQQGFMALTRAIAKPQGF